MAITKQRKAEIMDDLVSKFKEAKSIGFATTNTITVEEFARLRKNLREINASYTLAKKTIIKKALKEALNIDIELVDLNGQIGIVCSNDDAIAGLGKVNAFMKEVNGPKGNLGKLAWSISVFEGQVKTLEETKVLASLPSKETLLSRLVGSMKSPISALARFFDAAKKDLETKGVNSVGDLKNSNLTPISKEEEEKTSISKDVEISKEEIKLEVPVSDEGNKIEAVITSVPSVEKQDAETPVTTESKTEENEVLPQTPTDEKEEKATSSEISTDEKKEKPKTTRKKKEE